MKNKSRTVAFFLLLLAFVLGGCTSTQLTRVHPWERGALADATMDPNRDPVHTAMLEHVFFSREAAAGGRGVGGSGCGCN